MISNISLKHIHQLSSRLPALIAEAQRVYQNLELEMANLEKEGLIRATGHWRKGKYLCLVYPSKVGTPRVIKYVGSKPRKIDLAQAAMRRAIEYEEIKMQLERLGQIVDHCYRQIDDVTRMLIKFEGNVTRIAKHKEHL